MIYHINANCKFSIHINYLFIRFILYSKKIFVIEELQSKKNIVSEEFRTTRIHYTNQGNA